MGEVYWPGRAKPGDAIAARGRNARNDAIKRLGAWSAGPGLVAREGPGGRSIAILCEECTYARLTSSADTNGGYSWAEVWPTAPGGWTLRGRTGANGASPSDPAYERSGVTTLTAGAAVYEICRSDTSGEWLFKGRGSSGGGVSFCKCTSLPTTLTLATPDGNVTMTYSPSALTYFGCGSMNLLSFNGFPDASTGSFGDYMDYTFPGSPAGAPNTPNSIAIRSIPIAYWVDCQGIPFRLTMACPTIIRSAPSGFSEMIYLPYGGGSCGMAAVNTTNNYTAISMDAFCTNGSSINGGGSWTDTGLWPGVGGAAGSLGQTIGVSLNCDSGSSCSPFFARWTNINYTWGSYQTWFLEQPCYPSLSVAVKSQQGPPLQLGTPMTATFTLTP